MAAYSIRRRRPGYAGRHWKPTDSRRRQSGQHSHPTEQTTFRVRKVDAAGTITTVAGNGIGFSGDGGPAIQAKFGDLRGLAADQAGNLYIADYGNNRVRKVDPAGIVTTIAGIGTAGIFLENGDGGIASNARLSPSGLALDAAGNLYISDYVAARVRKINFAATPPGLSLSAWTMSFASTATSTPASQVLKVSSSGPPLPWRIEGQSDSNIGPWFTLSTATGTTPQTLTVSVRSGLAPGTYQGTITVTPTVAGYQPVTASVQVTISSTVPTKPVITSIVNGASFQACLCLIPSTPFREPTCPPPLTPGTDSSSGENYLRPSAA